MDFKQSLEELSEKIIQRKEFIINEEATKQSLIIPFIKILGYDVYNPLEVQPEFTSDFGFKKGEKVDYAIKKENKPIIFIEAKFVNEEITRHSAQLCRYFNATPEVKFSILTNGIQYKLFTDLDQDNIMDEEAFYSFDLSNLTTTDYEVIWQLSKEQFNKDELVNYSQELVYMTNINNTLKDLFKNPSDDFIRFLIKDIKNQRVTYALIERFRPIVKK
ncbi:type I restriction endonuclease [Priestia sp. SB1]|uniref:type I restriction endonuclease n=1 Tax=Priestia sp. SB1 TaxID=3132359 RepID=UPI00317F1AE0